MRDPQKTFNAFMSRIPVVYPLYLMSRIKHELEACRLENDVIKTVHAVETLGDCRYSIRVTDENGTSYRITVEVA